MGLSQIVVRSIDTTPAAFHFCARTNSREMARECTDFISTSVAHFFFFFFTKNQRQLTFQAIVRRSVKQLCLIVIRCSVFIV